MKKLLIPLLIASSICLFYGCPDDSPVKPKPVDPCAHKPVKTRIACYEEVGDSLVETDTIIHRYRIVVSAEGDSATEWNWDIEDGAYTQNTKSFKGNFTDPGQYRLKLIAKRIVNSKCYPDDDGIDTVYKMLVIKESVHDSKVLGAFRGFNLDNPSDTFVVTTTLFSYDKTFWELKMTNINRGCMDTFPNTAVFNCMYGYNSFSFYQAGTNATWCGCYNPIGFGYFNTANNEMLITYESGESTDRKKHVFKGVKI